MLSFVAKGYTVGHLFARRILRTLTSIPGIAIDLIIAAFWKPYYRSWWKDKSTTYADNTTVGLMQGIFGWIGEVAGYVIGAPIGTLIGVSLYIVDSAIGILYEIQHRIAQAFNTFATIIGRDSFFKNFDRFEYPKDFLEKSQNIGSAIIGGIIALPFIVVAKSIEFIIPQLDNKISNHVLFACSYLGNFVGATVSIYFFIPVFIMSEAIDLYIKTRNSIHNIVAIIYAKTNTEPVSDGGCCHQKIHSSKFHQIVYEQKHVSFNISFFAPGTVDNEIDNTSKFAIDEEPSSKPQTPYYDTQRILEWMNNETRQSGTETVQNRR